MIKEFEFYHGAVLSRLLGAGAAKIELYGKGAGNAAYVINDGVGLYVKHSTNRLTPWSFSFRQLHQDQILAMKQELEEVYIALVCNDDGIVCLSFMELKLILDSEHGMHEWVRVSRRTREKYAVSGSDGKLRWKIADNEFPSKIIASFLKLLA